MRRTWFCCAAILVLGSLGPEPAVATRYFQDFSGNAMQRYESRLPSSPMLRFPGVLGLTYWPYMAYPAAPTSQVFNFILEMPEEQEPVPPVQSKPPTTSKFWITHCGSVLEIDVTKANLFEEEHKDCGH
jgi:hypothetical protein